MFLFVLLDWLLRSNFRPFTRLPRRPHTACLVIRLLFINYIFIISIAINQSGIPIGSWCRRIGKSFHLNRSICNRPENVFFSTNMANNKWHDHLPVLWFWPHPTVDTFSSLIFFQQSINSVTFGRWLGNMWASYSKADELSPFIQLNNLISQRRKSSSFPWSISKRHFFASISQKTRPNSNDSHWVWTV